MSGNLLPLEMEVLRLALMSADSRIAEALRAQIQKLRVKNRTKTGVGFYTDFSLTDDPSREADTQHSLGRLPLTVNAKHKNGGKNLFNFIVWTESGKISFIEAVALTSDAWPEDTYGGFYDFRDSSGKSLGSIIS